MSTSQFPHYQRLAMETPVPTLERTSAEIRDRAVSDAREAERKLAEAVTEIAELRVALESLILNPVRYNDKTIEIDCFSHADAMERVRLARALLARTPK